MASFARRFLLELTCPKRVQEQVSAGRGADDSEDHIEPAGLSFKKLLIATLPQHISNPPTDKSDQQKQNDFVHYHPSMFVAATRRLTRTFYGNYCAALCHLGMAGIDSRFFMLEKPNPPAPRPSRREFRLKSRIACTVFPFSNEPRCFDPDSS